MYDNGTMAEECFPEKSSLCRDEQVCQGVKCKSPLSVPSALDKKKPTLLPVLHTLYVDTTYVNCTVHMYIHASKKHNKYA